MEHTPGPKGDQRPSHGPVLLNDHNKIIAAFDTGGPTKADASLISAAPDLLAALEAAFDAWYDDPRHIEVRELAWVGMARAAIDKAKGE